MRACVPGDITLLTAEIGFLVCVHTCNFTRREPFANGRLRVACVHTASGSSGTLRPHRKVFSVDADGTRRVGAAVWMLEWTHRVWQRRAVCACLHTNLFLSTPLICNAVNRARRNHEFMTLWGKSDTLTNHTRSRNWPNDSRKAISRCFLG